MKLQQLKYLLAIVDNGLNITAAADRLYTSQPGVSKQLKLLEDELGLQIFTRKGKSLDGITAAGDVVIGRARLIMREVDGIRSLSTPLPERPQPLRRRAQPRGAFDDCRIATGNAAAEPGTTLGDHR